MGNLRACCRSLEVVAISQAPSPESNPDSPLPVAIMVVLYTTIKIDRADIWKIYRRHKGHTISKVI
jgi:hypothetical protein